MENVRQGEEVTQATSTYLGEQRRRSTRIEQAAAVIIRGVDLLDQPFEERTAAQNLSFHGCRYASKHHLPKNTWVTLEVPSGESRAEAACVRARVAWIHRPQTLRDLFQVGVELERGRNVWGVAPAPDDWASGALGPASTNTESSGQQESTASGREHASLEVYLQSALAHATKGLATTLEGPLSSQEGSTLLEQLRQEFLAQSSEGVEAGSIGADGPPRKATNEARESSKVQQQADTETFHGERIEELAPGKSGAKVEIATDLMQNVETQLASFEERMRGTLMSDWVLKLSHAQVARSDWEAEVQALRSEMRSVAEECEKRSEEKLRKKVSEIQCEWGYSRTDRLERGVAADYAEAGEPARAQRLQEMEIARAQWNELVESSLDSAARRLSDRLSNGSQELARHTEQEMAKKITEMQKESGLAAETARAALCELRVTLEGELSRAKTALREIEQTAGRFSEYSRQLEAASQDSLNDLRQKLESSMARQCAEFDRHASDVEKGLGERAAARLEQVSFETATQGIEQIGKAVASGLASAAKASEELVAREEQAEDILRIHRERLRQVSEQAQRETAENLASQRAMLQKEMEEQQTQNLMQWTAELAAGKFRAAEQTAASLSGKVEQSLAEADAQLLSQAQRSTESAQKQLQEELHVLAGRFRDELGETEARQVASARKTMALQAHEQLESAKNEFTRAAERAASEFGELMEGSGKEALEAFAAASKASAEDEKARLLAEGETALAGIQSHAQSSFEHFQEQVGLKAEQALQRATETMAHQFEITLERFRTQGEARLADWTVKQESVSAQTLEKHNAQLHQAANSWVEMMLERLDSRSEERVDSAVRATENAVREACVDIFENLTQAMKRQLQGTLEIRPAAPGGEVNSKEHRASA